MFNTIRKEINWGGRNLSIETGKIARQADGAAVVTYGGTVVLCTVVAQKTAKEGVDFFPLTVNYIEKTYAAGKIPGGFFKREGRPTDKETLASRLIDRPIRPLFPENFYNETQIICTVVSHDPESDAEIAALVGASAALAISGVPFDGPVGAARVGSIDGQYILNPTPNDMAQSDLDLVVAGTNSSVLMVESEANLLDEEEMLGAVTFGHEQFQPVIQLIKELQDEAGKPRWEIEQKDYASIKKQISEFAEKNIRDAYKIKEKQARSESLNEIREKTTKHILDSIGEEEFDAVLTAKLIKSLEQDIVRNDILKTGKRIDGRDEKSIRPIECEVEVLPKTHGSALFTRGETQALVVATLGTSQDQQLVDALDGSFKESFMLHYNFPAFSVGEVGFLRGPGRREVGHGKLAWRAIHPILPSLQAFPYTLRVVSEITESNGSSSMATVCGTSLALMDAGVPLENPVAGIAMGLIKEGGKFSVLSDILGDEDHLGDMDFKVAGTKDGITALQMDIKINGITTEIMEVALKQAKKGRLHILEKMSAVLAESRQSISKNAPQIISLKIDKDKIGALIGPGGKIIKEICETSGATVDIEEDGTVNVAAVNADSIEKAKSMILNIVIEPEIGSIYDGQIVRILDFGVLVKFLGNNEGMVHISEIIDEHIENIYDQVEEGQQVKVKIISIDRGKIRLSMKRVNQDSGEDLSDQFEDDTYRPSPGRRRSSSRRGGNGGGRDRDNGGSNRRPSEAPRRKKRRFF